jgi:tetratricopeptide (TPR) repeat protein
MENNKNAISDFISKFNKLKNLGAHEFVRQEIIFKGNNTGFELDNIENMLGDTLFEKDEARRNEILNKALTKTNQIIANLNDTDNKSNALFIRYECLYKLKRYEESLIAIMQAIQIYQNDSDIYPSRLRLYYEKAVELLIYFEQYEETILICNYAELLCKNDMYAIVNELEEIISNRAKALFYLGRQNEAILEIDKAIYLFPKGDKNQYKTYRAIEIRGLFKKETGDQEGYLKDLELNDKWQDLYHL